MSFNDSKLIQNSYSEPGFNGGFFLYTRYLLTVISDGTYVSLSYPWDFFVIVETFSLNNEFSNSYHLFVGIVVFVPI